MNLNTLVSRFFDEENYGKLAEKIVVLRSDGISVYSNIEDNFEAASIGALVSGVWQAAESLSGFLKSDNNFYEFRLGFDTTADGLFILPLKILNKRYYICAIYKSVDNPAKLKRNISLLKNNLELYLSELSIDAEENRKGYLFDNISDDEMDRLFSFGGA